MNIEKRFALNKFFVDKNQIDGNKIIIINDDVNHIKNVLRFEIHEKIMICSKETGINYVCEISDISKDKVTCEIKKKSDFDSESNVKIDVFQGLPKADKMELIIQKGTELRSK